MRLMVWLWIIGGLWLMTDHVHFTMQAQAQPEGLAVDGDVYQRWPEGVAVDITGNVYVADTANYRILKITPDGVVSTLAPVTGSEVQFYFPKGVAVDSGGNVYVADTQNSAIRKITPGGAVTTLAGGNGWGNTDGPSSVSRFARPGGVAVDSAGAVYVADTGNQKIRKITPDGVASTLAGAGYSGSADGVGSAARFYEPSGVAVDSAGNVYVADTDNHTIRKITPDGVVSTLAGLAGNSGSADGTGSAARFSRPHGVAVDSAGNVYVGDTENCTIRKITPDGVVSTLAGLAGNPGSADGTGSAARFGDFSNGPTGVAVDIAGNVYVADTGNATIRMITSDGVVSTLGRPRPSYTPYNFVTLAGLLGSSGSQDGPGSVARFSGPNGVAVDSAANVYVADYGNHTIRKITSDGMVTTLAGRAGSSGSADGVGSAARFGDYGPAGVTVDNAGNVYVADSGNQTIRKITPDGRVTTLAGLAGSSGSADGVGSAARFARPVGVAVDSTDNVYVADTDNLSIRKITPGAVVSTLATGLGTVVSNYFMGGWVTYRFGPAGIAVASDGVAYMAASYDSTILKITPAGAVSTLAGLAGNSGSADGMGNAAQFSRPNGVAVDRAGNIYVADSGNHTIRKISPDGVVTTLAGVVGSQGSADGVGSAAQFYIPSGVAVDSTGNVYVADSGNQTIRKGWPAALVPPSVISGPVGQTTIQGSTVAFFVRATGYSLSYQWIKDGLTLTGQTHAILVLTNVQAAQAGLYTVTVHNMAGTVTSPAASLTVNSPVRPAITTGPASQTVMQGSTVRFQVTATGSFLSYQWLKDGVILDGQTNTFLTFSQAQTADAGNYTVAVSNGAGSVTSQVAMLTVLLPITVTIQPWDSTTLQTHAGAYVVFTATVTAAGPFNYQWNRNETPIVGATNAALVLNRVQEADSGNYSVVVANPFGYGTAVVGLLVGPPPAYTFVTLAGAAGVAGSADGTGSAARFSGPSGVAVDSAGNVYVADSGNYTIRKITPAGVVSTLAGKAGSYGSEDGTGNAARFGTYWSQPVGIAVDSTGNVYVAEGGNNTIRKITPDGVVSTLAGQAGIQGLEDGTLSTARFNSPEGLAVDRVGSIYVAETAGATIRKITSDGLVTTLAGRWWGSADGIASAARFFSPNAVGVDGAGNVYVADCGNSTIRKITPDGVVSTLAGQVMTKGSADGTGNAARFDDASGPSNSFHSYGLAVDVAGNVYVADSGNCTIRKITPDGVVRTVAGVAGSPGSEDGTGSAARFGKMHNDSMGGYVIGPQGVAVDSAGNLYVADTGNHTIRKGWLAEKIPTAPVILLPLDSGVILEGAPTNLVVEIVGDPTPDLQWFFNAQPIAGATNSVYTIPAFSSVNAGTYTVIASNALGSVTNEPATLGANNVVSSNFVGLVLTAPKDTSLQIQSAASVRGPWSALADLTLPASPYAYLVFTATNAQQHFYRTTQRDRLEAWLFPGWTFTQRVGSRYKLEYVNAEVGFTHWQFLTNLTLPASPYLFIDTTATNKWPRFYRTTPIP